MWLRFHLLEDGSTTTTQWQEELVTYGEVATAVIEVQKLRAANPDAKISIERRTTRPDDQP